MSTLRAAAQQALEALDAYSWEQVNAARAALRTALAEPETEAETYKRLYELRGKALERPCFHCGYKPEKIYPMGQRKPPEQGNDYERGFVDGMSHQAMSSVDKAVNAMARKPLTNAEIGSIEMGLRKYVDGDRYDLSLSDFARAIERAHGIGGEA